MPMRMSGLISGLDTDTLISQLVSARKFKVTKAKGDQTKLGWKQDIWKDLNKQLVSLRSTMESMRFASSFQKKTTAVSNSAKASVITGNGAVNSVQSLEISQLAKSGYLTGGTIKAVDDEGNATGEKVTALSKLSSLGYSSGSTTLNITTNGETMAVTVGPDSTISDVLSGIKKAGLNASFDENNQRFFISSKTTGAAADFSITASDSNGQALLADLGISVYDKTAVNNLRAYASLSDSDISTKAATDALKRAQTEAEAYKSLFNSKVDADASVTDLQKQLDELPESANALERTKLEKQLEAARTKADSLAEQLTAAESDPGFKFDRSNFTFNDDTGKITSMGDVEATDELVSSIEEEYRNRRAFAATQLEEIENGTLTSTATKITGQDAEIKLNGATFTNSTNVFDINGLTITALSETADGEEVTLTTTDDTSGIYDMVKNFLKQYNTVVNQLAKLYNADSASKYSMLTDDEKEAMSEKEVEKYEGKIKDSLLKGDTTINSINSALTSIMAQGVELDGKKHYLSEFGINTLSYFDAEANETNAYHIDGDADDTRTSGNADKLKGLIASEPEFVTKFFNKLSQSLYSKLSDMSSRVSGRRTYGSFYEDQTMKSDYTGYTSKIAELEQKANDYEDKMYAKFSKMEAAMAKLQSKTSALTGLFGGN